MLYSNLYVCLTVKFSTCTIVCFLQDILLKSCFTLSVVEFIGQARGVLREVWYNVNMDLNRVATMHQHRVFKTPPESQWMLRDFDAPVTSGNSHVQRLTSYLQVNFDIYH